MRAFISIELPENVKAGIFHTFEKLKGSGFCSGNFVEKNNLHLTLKFLGDISEEDAEKIAQKLSEIDFRKFAAETGEISFFPNEDYVKVIWVELVSKEIFGIKKIIEEKLSEIGIPKEEREFSSHITVARIKNIKDKVKFAEKIKDLKSEKYFFIIDELSLIKSELTKEGPKYKVLKNFVFRN